MNGSSQSSVLTPPTQAGGRAWTAGVFERWALESILRHVGEVPLRIRFGDATAEDPRRGAPIATVTIRRRSTLLALVRDPDVGFGEAFMSGDIEVDGDLVGLLEAVFRTQEADATARRGNRARANTPGVARENVHHHYDVGNDFYRLWLDDRMAYTCAYFPSPDATLEDAQIAKMDLVCRKLGLRPGEHVVEAGCGWGALALHMACHYGVTVTACNISREQIRYARDWAASEELGSRVEFVEDDYRAIRRTADAFVSVGMVEHVGAASYADLGGVILRVLGNHRGRGLLHFIGRSRPCALQPWISRRIFPGAYPPTLDEAIGGILGPVNMAVLDVENLRLHYAKTLDHWRRRFVAASETIRRAFDEPFERAWRLYLSGAQAAFMAGSMQLFQVVFAPAGSNAIPWTRGTNADEFGTSGRTIPADGQL